jgi:hypothetical protein
MTVGSQGLLSFAPQRRHQIILQSVLAFVTSFSSSIAWKLSDADFATKVGSDYLAESYFLSALMLFLSSYLMLSSLKKESPQKTFIRVQKAATIGFSVLAVFEWFFHISQYQHVIFAMKGLGYAFSYVVINAFWISLDVYSRDSTVTKAQCTWYLFCSYVSMAAAGFCLQSETLSSSQLGICVAACSTVCWAIGKFAYELPLKTTVVDPVLYRRPSARQVLWGAMRGSPGIATFVIASVLLSVLASSTEYSFIVDFEAKYMSLTDASQNIQSFGSFVTLIGLGNILTLFSSQLCSRYRLGRASIPLATVGVCVMIRLGFADNHSIFSSVLTLLTIESLYPLIVESNLSHLLGLFHESERVSARLMLDTIIEPTGLALSAVFLEIPYIDINTLGVAVVVVAMLLAGFSCTIDKGWKDKLLQAWHWKQAFLARQVYTALVAVLTLLSAAQIDETPDALWLIDDSEWVSIPIITE